MPMKGADSVIYTRTEQELSNMRQCGEINAQVHEVLRHAIQPGITTRELDAIAGAEIRQAGAKSSIRDALGFPGDICISINEEVGHGIPGDYAIQPGDLVKIDISIEYAGYHTDCAYTHIIEPVPAQAAQLVAATRQALAAGIQCARPGGHCSDISYAIGQMIQDSGYAVIRHANGHGIGTSLHEDPIIANFGPPGRGPRLREGMVIAVEPVVSMGTRYTLCRSDGWTDVTADGSLCAHFEHTIVITDGQPEILTKLPNSTSDRPALPVQYRDMREDDKSRLLQLAAAGMDDILITAWGRRVRPDEIFDPSATTKVLETEDGLAGFFTYSERQDVMFLHTVVIASDIQGQGLGKQVMRYLEEAARARGLAGVELCVQTNNRRAIRFYERLGFQPVEMPYANTKLMHKAVTSAGDTRWS